MRRLKKLIICVCPALLLAASASRAQTVVWSDNFDTNGASRWMASATGVWKIGAPTAGPPLISGSRAYSGPDCASSQGYAYNKNVRLVCHNYNGAGSLLIPAANLYPRLRFWQWFNFANALGYVEVSTNSGGSWTQISPTYLNINGGGVWSSPSLDLSGYAGQNVLIAFHFTSGGCCGNALGWFVDDVSVVTGTPTVNFPEDFAAGLGDWSVDFGTWQVGAPTSGPRAAYTGVNCAATVLAGDYANNVDSRLISPPFLVPASGSPALTFWHWYSFDNALGYVELNNGSITVTTVTNTTITTNTVVGGLNTNIYQLFGSADPNYSAPFYWNQTIGGWTNNLPNDVFKMIGNVFVDSGVLQGYYFEAGDVPLTNDIGGVEVDYRADISPTPLSNATNYLALQGVTWEPITEGDYPIGYFATNSTITTYTTNTTVSTGESSWTQISPTYEDSTSSGHWTNVSLDLSAYAGQTVFIAFHFTSGGVYTDPGWYVDDISLDSPPDLIVPTNTVIEAGDMLDETVYATNGLPANAQYTFRLLSPPANVSIGAASGEITWQTSPNQPSSTNTITVVVTDNNVPPFSVTNSFTVTVVNPLVLTVPPTQKIYAGGTLTVTNIYATNSLSSSDTFTFTLLTPLATNLEASDLDSTSGILTWPTTTAQPAGTYVIGIQAADDQSPYSATNSFLVVISKPTPPVLKLPPTQTIYAGQTLVITNIYATNSALPGSMFTYAVTNSPGVSIDPISGELAWPTTPTNKAQTVTISVVATDNNTPPLRATGSFKVTVSPTPGPTLIVPATQTNYAGMTLTTNIFATNAALGAATFSFRLLSPTNNVSIFTTNGVGVLTWTTTCITNGILTWTNDAVAPGTKVVTVAVDASSADYPKGSLPPSLSATNHFNIVFLPPHPPSILGVTNQEILVGQTPFPMQASATNNYALLTSAVYTFTNPANLPANTNIAVTNGLITWRNTHLPQGTNRLSIAVRDNSRPPLMATNPFALTILPPSVLLVPTNQTMHAGQTWAITISATNAFSRGSRFTFGLPSPSTNYSIANTNGVGVLTWTNTFMATNGVLNWSNSVSPGTNVIPVIATDNSPLGLTAATNVDLIILPPLPPTLNATAAQSIYAGQTLVVTNYATNAALTNCTFTYTTSGPGNMNATNGLLIWATLSTQSSETYTNTVTVMDNSAPPLTATKSFVIVLSNAPPPTLTVPTTQRLYAGQQLTATNSASSIYGTSSSFTFQLLSVQQAGMSLTPNGVFSWNVPASQPAGNYTNIITVQDSVSQFSTSSNFVVVVSNPPPPTLTVPPTQRLYAGQRLTATNTASSIYGTNSSFTFQLLSVQQTGMSLTPNGVFSWNVPTNQPAGTNTITISVTDNMSLLSATSNLVVVVSRTFPHVELAVPPTQTIYAGLTLQVTNYGYYTNSVLPSSAFTYALLSTNVPGVNLDTNTGVLIWPTTIAQPTGTFTNIIMVMDGLTDLSATSNFLVQVLPPVPPTLIVPSTQAIYAGQMLVVTLIATNAAYPGSTFTFGAIGPTNLDVSNLPEGGVLKWTPTAAQAPSENTIYVIATESNSLSTNGSFLALVYPTPPPQLTIAAPPSSFAANGFRFTVNTMGDTLWRIDASSNLLSWWPVATNLASPSGSLQFTDPVATNYLQRFYRAVLP